jgi:hypothetical protein
MPVVATAAVTSFLCALNGCLCSTPIALLFVGGEGLGDLTRFTRFAFCSASASRARERESTLRLPRPSRVEPLSLSEDMSELRI